ncbi:MAG: hypothetical protein AAGO57_05855 [Pseudomonadota bacterium]
MATALQVLRVIAAVVGTALVMLAWSELIFFNEGPAEALIAALTGGALVTLGYIAEVTAFYAIPAAFLVGLVRLFGSQGLGRIMVIGALTGYSIEGAVVAAVYEAVPLSYLWTSVAWHGPITVALGVFVLPRLMTNASVFKMVGVSLLLGAAWALWTTWIWVDGNASIVPAGDFYWFAAATWTLLLLGYGLCHFAQWPNIAIPRWFAIVMCLPTAILWVVQGLQVPIFGIGLLVIIAGLLLALSLWGRDIEAGYKIKQTNLSVFILMPATAALVYGIILETGTPIGSEDLVSLVFVAGMIAWLYGIVHQLRRHRKRRRT